MTESGGGPGVQSKATQRWTLVATILASGVVFLDGTVVNVALPAINRALNTGLSGLQWIIDGYVLTLAALLILGVSLGDRYLFAECHGLFCSVRRFCVGSGLTAHAASFACVRQVGRPVRTAAFYESWTIRQWPGPVSIDPVAARFEFRHRPSAHGGTIRAGTGSHRGTIDR
jgi:MFS family permease